MCVHCSCDSITSALRPEAARLRGVGVGRRIKDHSCGLSKTQTSDQWSTASITRAQGKIKNPCPSWEQTIQFMTPTDGCLWPIMTQRERPDTTQRVQPDSQWELLSYKQLYLEKTSIISSKRPHSLICLQPWLLFKPFPAWFFYSELVFRCHSSVAELRLFAKKKQRMGIRAGVAETAPRTPPFCNNNREREGCWKTRQEEEGDAKSWNSLGFCLSPEKHKKETPRERWAAFWHAKKGFTTKSAPSAAGCLTQEESICQRKDVSNVNKPVAENQRPRPLVQLSASRHSEATLSYRTLTNCWRKIGGGEWVRPLLGKTDTSFIRLRRPNLNRHSQHSFHSHGVAARLVSSATHPLLSSEREGSKIQTCSRPPHLHTKLVWPVRRGAPVGSERQDIL